MPFPRNSTGRNLIICCDGTNNQFGIQNTNVIRLVQILDRDHAKQRLYYQPGIGTLPEPDTVTKWWTQFYDVLGLAFGLGVIKNIQDAYRFLMDMWEQNDQIFLFGFSRGAYTVRVLAGMLHAVGLLGHGSHEMIPYAMRLYRQVNKPSASDDKIGEWKKLCADFRWTFARPMFDGDTERHCRVHFIGVWDTVSSVGWFTNPAKFAFTAANPSVDIIRHAVSIDERRAFFRQNLFHRATSRQDLTEIWFPGSHCDVGGGYPSVFSNNPEIKSELWRLPFEWIVDEAQRAGLVIDQVRLDMVVVPPSPSRDIWADPTHESLIGWWSLAEQWPKKTWDSQTKTYHWQAGNSTSRSIPEGALIHNSALERLRKDSLNYAPPNMSEQFRQSVISLPTLPSSLPYRSGDISTPSTQVNNTTAG
ncbi:MAG TPA: DUF2235 domain-containing protein [Candidatus Udaeobacter sp.]|jgi:uncharacterized protein (DUF2235 family)|nr:DUF2235 domain-containing protein [Candidatus Udaeobacter sp.]